MNDIAFCDYLQHLTDYYHRYNGYLLIIIINEHHQCHLGKHFYLGYRSVDEGVNLIITQTKWQYKNGRYKLRNYGDNPEITIEKNHGRFISIKFLFSADDYFSVIFNDEEITEKFYFRLKRYFQLSI